MGMSTNVCIHLHHPADFSSVYFNGKADYISEIVDIINDVDTEKKLFYWPTRYIELLDI